LGQDGFRRGTGDPMKTLPADHEVMHTLSFPTFSVGGQRCRPVARYGGIHLQSGDYAGLGRQVAQFVWGTAQNRRPSSGRAR
jgi:hypothetical protein